MIHRPLAVGASLAFLLTGASAGEVFRDIPFARVGDVELKLDVYLPESTPRAPLIVYVHGGAWRSGSKGEMPLSGLVERGFAVASVDYRLTPFAPFPAQVHDIKGAIRFLRAKAVNYGCDATRIAIVGSSAGGHLAALVGVTSGVRELEGETGGNAEQSSAVQAIVSFYGASNLESILAQSTPHGLNVRVPALQLLLGGQPAEKPALARLASPVAHLDAADPQMPPEQSLEFQRRCVAAKVAVQLVNVPGGQHGGPEFYDDARLGIVADFLQKQFAR